jgi:hypothetical protein
MYQCTSVITSVIRKGIKAVGYEKRVHTEDFYKAQMPKYNYTTLCILQELGHRFHGRVYRAMSKNGNLCVLKYFVKSQPALMENGTREDANAETAACISVGYWNKAYRGDPPCLPAATWGKWGGGVAMIMPDLEKISATADRHIALRKLEKTMKERFFDRDLWHADPAWRNVALVRNKDNDDISKVVMIDLEPQHMLEKKSNWKFTTMWDDFKQRLGRGWESFLQDEGCMMMATNTTSESVKRPRQT